jgi:EpsI family protein
MNRQIASWPRFLLVVALLVGAALMLRSRGHAEGLPPREPLSSFPLRVGKWRGHAVAIPDWALRVLGNGEFAERAYVRDPNQPYVDLFLAYFPSERMGSSPHSPQNCLPGSGWSPVTSARVNIPGLNGNTMRVNRYIVAKDLNRMLVYYWYQSHGRVTASEYWAKVYLVEDSIRLNRSDGAMIRVSTPIAENESLASAERRGLTFTEQVLPQLDHFIPR